ncbi:AEC family transporter [Rhizobium deserti]|uniref:AEC family transporter n=1 Tax=Rhizobium deserti TaxID=2547961 RepID=A0A4V3APE0_9HYPH|nr:AEC family transporter [Rhizobium deserti]TDK36595.1 AEC family transporter [Rhizobium deserti]
MADIIALLLPFFGLILVGYVAARVTRQPAEALGWMNTFIIYAALPALFFKLVSRTPVEQLTRLDFILGEIGATYIVFTILFLIGYFIRRNSFGDCTIQAFAGSYGNIGYMGPGLALLAFGEAAAVPVALIVCFENAAHFIVTPAMMAMAGGDQRPAREVMGEIIRKVVFHPFILSTALGFCVAAIQVQPPEPVARLVDYLAQAAAPCALFAMGVTLAIRPVRRIPGEIVYILFFKLILLPLTTYLVLSLIGNFEPVWIYSAVLLSALPTATNVFVISQQYGVWQERASASILIITLASVITLPGVLFAIHMGLLPADLVP